MNKLKITSIAICCLVSVLWSDAQCSQRDQELADLWGLSNPSPAPFQELSYLSEKIQNRVGMIKDCIAENDSIIYKKQQLKEHVHDLLNLGFSKEELSSKYEKQFICYIESIENNSIYINNLIFGRDVMMDKYIQLTGKKHFLDPR